MLKRKLFRTALKYKAQFISMIIMVFLGVGIFVGFNVEWYTLKKNTSDFIIETNYADYRIYDEQGFSESDILKIKNIDGINNASRVFNVNVETDNNKALSLFVLEDYNVSKMKIINGSDYDENLNGFWLSDKYAAANNLKLNDSLTIKYLNVEISSKVIGLVKSAEFMICVQDNNQLMPDYNNYGFCYASPKLIFNKLQKEYYPQINIKSNLKKNDIEEKINNELNKTIQLLSKEEHVSYSGAKSEIEEGQTMASILPLLFLLIGILTMITTMHRITINEKMQIGTLKALGFKNRKIIMHYVSYGTMIGIIGTILGTILGFAIGKIIVNPNYMQGTYFDMPNWHLSMPLWTIPMLILIVLLLELINYLSVHKILKGSAATTLRPYVPKKIKKLKIEKTKIWKKISFNTKWNIRDIMRHKTRSFMTLFGVICCMLLLVGGLGMKDTMNGFLDSLEKQSLNYETRINMVEMVDNEQAKLCAKQYDGDYISSQFVKISDDSVSLDIYNIEHGFINFCDEKGKEINISDEGIYICKRIKDLGIKIGDKITFSPYGTNNKYEVNVLGVIRSYTSKCIVMTENYANKIGINYHISAIFTNYSQKEIVNTSIIANTQSKETIMESYKSFMQIMDVMVFVLLIGAVILGIVVLYNLGVMSYMERYGELATLKVVGFKDKHIGKILISQNLWITILGIIIGIPSGALVLQILLTLLAREYELSLIIGILTYSISIFVTLGTSLFVNYLIAKKNKKIDMTSALKGID